MDRYYFLTCDQDGVSGNDEAIEFRSIEKAVEAARIALAEFVLEGYMGNKDNVTIDVLSEERKTLAKVQLRYSVEFFGN